MNDLHLAVELVRLGDLRGYQCILDLIAAALADLD
jgi:hypothetical protein